MTSMQEWRSNLKPRDRVYVLVVYGTDAGGEPLIKRRPGRVQKVVRGAAQVQLEGEKQPRMIKFAELELPDGDPIMKPGTTAPHLFSIGDATEADLASEKPPPLDTPAPPASAWCPMCGAPKDELHAVDCSVPGVRKHEPLPDLPPPPEPSDPIGPEEFRGTDEGSHLMAQTSASKLLAADASPATGGEEVRVDDTGDDDGTAVGEALAGLLDEAQAILNMRAPVVKRLEGQLGQLLTVRREVNGRIEKVERMLDLLNADATYGSPDDGTNDDDDEWDVARPRDRERIEKYLEFIDTCLGTGPCPWNEIRAYVIEQHPRVDTRLLGSALGVGKYRGRYEHDGRRGGMWSLTKEDA